MGILTTVGLRRPHKWEPRTLLDWFLHSPLQFLVSKLYSLLLFLRGHPFRPPRNKKPIRVVCISDTHDATVDIPPGDLLIHAGDMTNRGTAEDIQKQIDWLVSQPHEHKVVICGNHDSWFDPDAREPEDAALDAPLVDLTGINYLYRENVTLRFQVHQRELNVWGAGDVPELGLSRVEDAYEYPRDQPPWDEIIPRPTDVLVTHTPPAYHLDNGLGCPGLMRAVWRVRPKLHVFGHVHWGHGRRSVFFDKSQRAYERLMARPGYGPMWDFLPNRGWLYAVKVLWFGIQAVLFKWLMQGPGGGEGCLMVNAAAMYGNTGQMTNKAVVIDL